MLVADAVNLLDLVALSRLLDILIRQFGENLPGGTLSIWCISALLLFGGYWLAQAQFLRVELPVKKAKKCC